MFLGLLPLALLLAAAGSLLLVAESRSASPAGRLADRMTDGFDRTARAVDVLIDPRPGEVLPTRESDTEQQRATYVVVGGGLLGLSAILTLGLLLLVVS